MNLTVPGNISDFHDLSRFQMFPMCPIGIVSTWLEPPLLPVTPYHRFHSFFLLAALSLIKNVIGFHFPFCSWDSTLLIACPDTSISTLNFLSLLGSDSTGCLVIFSFSSSNTF